MSKLLQRYQQDCQQPEFLADPQQQLAVEALASLLDNITEQHHSWSYKFQRFLHLPTKPVRGYYFWGGVGRGKTYLMDLFFDCIPFTEKKRLHFHRFMRHVHHELAGLKQVENPLEIVANKISKEAEIVCFDEFFVTDIADAMLLAGLFKSLFQYGVTLVATSNIPPDDLYRDGLQRALFLPAIDLIKTHCEVINVDNGVDYRLRTLEKVSIYHTPDDQAAQEQLTVAFKQLAPEAISWQQAIEVEGRWIETLAVADDVVWFNFASICGGPRSSADYIEIACCFHTVIISGVPVLGASEEDQARRWIALVDEFYDHSVKLIVSAAAVLEMLYQGQQLKFEFKRTISRLTEMQTAEYLARPHSP